MESPAEDKRPAPRKPLDRDPTPPSRDTLAPVQGRVLDPATAIAVDDVFPRPTVYVGPRLVISKSIDVDGALEVLRVVAGRLGWRVELEREDPRTARLRFGVRRASITLAAPTAATAPDGWVLLQQTRAQFGVDAVRG